MQTLVALYLMFAIVCSKNAVNPSSAESSNLISFSEGIIPNAWLSTEWTIDNTSGYDDLYSLKTTTNHAVVMTDKTFNSNINFVEFFLKGSGIVDFHVNGSKRKVCTLTDKWVRHAFYFEKGPHTLKWELRGDSASLDAVRFKKEAQLGVGTYYRGGIIVYIDDANRHGLIAAPEDQSTGIQWHNGEYMNIGAIGRNMGTGKLNTQKIVQVQGMGNYAAKICDDLVLNGYDDWYLPSKDELDMIYQNKDAIGGFKNISTTSAFNYWSSSEDTRTVAWCQRFDNGKAESHYKNETFGVRAVRIF